MPMKKWNRDNPNESKIIHDASKVITIISYILLQSSQSPLPKTFKFVLIFHLWELLDCEMFFFCIQSITIIPAHTSSKIHAAIIPPEYKTPISSNLQLLRLSDQILHSQYIKALTINLLKQFFFFKKKDMKPIFQYPVPSQCDWLFL